MAEGEAPERGGGEAGEGSGTDRQGAASKVDEWRRYFRDRGLSAGDIPKALVVHEVRASRGIARGAAAQTGRGAGERGWSSGRCLGAPVPRAQHAPRVPPPCGVLRRGAAEASERARRAPVRAGDWPRVVCVELGRVLQRAAVQSARLALLRDAQRAVLCSRTTVRGGAPAARVGRGGGRLRQICSTALAARAVPSPVGPPPHATLCDAAAVEGGRSEMRRASQRACPPAARLHIGRRLDAWAVHIRRVPGLRAADKTRLVVSMAGESRCSGRSGPSRCVSRPLSLCAPPQDCRSSARMVCA